ncbi:MAG: type II/IV secretion system ATPase subunit [Candidatus Pacearchaeota archaeon]
MIFRPETKLYSYEVVREAGQDVMYINYIGHPSVPSIADSAIVMARTIDNLIESPRVSKIVFVQQRNYVYDLNQTSLLIEIAQLYTFLIEQEKILSPKKLIPFGEQQFLQQRYNAMRWLILTLLKQDPIGCYIEAKRLLREEKINAERIAAEYVHSENAYIRLLSKIVEMLEGTRLIREARDIDIEAHKIGDREIYRKFFRPDVVPNFTFTRLMASLPIGADILDEYKVESGYDKSLVTILKIPGTGRPIYHLQSPEFMLEENFYSLIDLARSVLIEHRPKAEEFIDPQRTRQVFFNISRDLLRELAESRKISLSYRQLNKLATILVRHTIGFGLIEVLLQDERLQDIVVNAPVSQTPIFVRHQDFDECVTNIIPAYEDAEAWAARFRLISGRPLDEANPVLDTDLEIENVRARVAIIQQPLSPYGLAYALRRHREKPWTLPLFIKNRMINPITAGLLSFLIDGSRTILFAGTRSAGKTSLLAAAMLEIIPKYRIIVIEDTLEMPVNAFKKLGYDILRMKVRSALLRESTEMEAADGIRTSLRLGDSSLIVGEVRSDEAKALYEAMRIGALANVVAGTIHGGSPYAVFDRVVNDLGVPITSFKATDIVLVANPIKSPDGIHSWRRVTQFAEIRKHWQRDPLEEKGFVDLLTYDVKKDSLEPSTDLINGESEVIKTVAGQVKGWAGDWDAVWDNILLRANIKQELVEKAKITGIKDLLEAPFVLKSNNMFHEFSDKITKEIGIPEGKRVFSEWKDWLNEEIRKRTL